MEKWEITTCQIGSMVVEYACKFAMNGKSNRGHPSESLGHGLEAQAGKKLRKCVRER